MGNDNIRGTACCKPLLPVAGRKSRGVLPLLDFLTPEVLEAGTLLLLLPPVLLLAEGGMTSTNKAYQPERKESMRALMTKCHRQGKTKHHRAAGKKRKKFQSKQIIFDQWEGLNKLRWAISMTHENPSICSSGETETEIYFGVGVEKKFGPKLGKKVWEAVGIFRCFER